MGSRWSSAPRRSAPTAIEALVLLVAGTAPLRAQTVWEAGPQVTVTAAKRSALVAGPFVAVRPSSRVRMSVGAGAGGSSNETTWRGELLGHFLVTPDKRRGVGWYGAGGVAAVGGPFNRGYLVLVLGVEARPGARSGWAVEGGIGGGVRLAVGYRFRWMSRGGRIGP